MGHVLLRNGIVATAYSTAIMGSVGALSQLTPYKASPVLTATAALIASTSLFSMAKLGEWFNLKTQGKYYDQLQNTSTLFGTAVALLATRYLQRVPSLGQTALISVPASFIFYLRME